MIQVVVARSCEVQALFALLQVQGQDIFQQLQRLPNFVDCRLTESQFQTDKPGYFAKGGRTLVRWWEGEIGIVITWIGTPNTLNIDCIQKLDCWEIGDPRYNKVQHAMHKIVIRIAKELGWKQVRITPSDPSLEIRLRGLDRGYGFGNEFSGDTKYLAVVAMQGLGYDPFIRVYEGAAEKISKHRQGGDDDLADMVIGAGF